MTTDLSTYDASQIPSADVLGRQRYAIVVADWNSEITYSMAQGAIDTFVHHGVLKENIDVSLLESAVLAAWSCGKQTAKRRVQRASY